MIFFLGSAMCVALCPASPVVRDGPCAALLVGELHDLCAVWQ